jgi:hypothetical protein
MWKYLQGDKSTGTKNKKKKKLEGKRKGRRKKGINK